MAILFKTLLADAGIDPMQAKMLRHKPGGVTDPLQLWREVRTVFEDYQSVQRQARRSDLKKPIWVSFLALPGGKTIFLGLYRSELVGPVGEGEIDPLGRHPLSPTEHDRYACTPMEELSEYAGRLFIDWGPSERQWVQHAHSFKPVTEIYETYREPNFPGYLELIVQLSGVATLPGGWVDFLREGRGIYLLTCPRTKEQYVGKADGAEGFWGRWLFYANTGHGGNVQLKSRSPSDYQVSILEVAGSSATPSDILKMESRWKAKLQSREMGLNSN